MNNIFYTYNNEAIACCAIYSVVKRLTKISAATISMILPFLLNDRIVEKLKSTKAQNLLDFIAQNRNIFLNFEGRYMSFLPITVNSVVLLKDFGLIKFEKPHTIVLNRDDDFDFSQSGERLMQVLSVSGKFAQMLTNADIVKLFNDLKIML
ncbi:MAG: hypothetical protein IKP73_01965 [Bacteroidales bacterium]|nr:hypothetical protein [Bacteroidales bacterium]